MSVCVCVCVCVCRGIPSLTFFFYLLLFPKHLGRWASYGRVIKQSCAGFFRSTPAVCCTRRSESARRGPGNGATRQALPWLCPWRGPSSRGRMFWLLLQRRMGPQAPRRRVLLARARVGHGTVASDVGASFGGGW